MRRTLCLLDSGVLNDIAFPQGSPTAEGCWIWFEERVTSGWNFRVPMVCYYEVRRRFVLNSLSERLSVEIRQRYKLRAKWFDQFCTEIGLVMMDGKTMKIASKLWAEAHHLGFPTASKDTLDNDVLIAATAVRLSRGEREVVIVTKNVRHLARYDTTLVTSRPWDDASLL